MERRKFEQASWEPSENLATSLLEKNYIFLSKVWKQLDLRMIKGFFASATSKIQRFPLVGFNKLINMTKIEITG